MWGEDKKNDQKPGSTAPITSATPISWEGHAMAPSHSMYPSKTSSGIARLGENVHVKGEITGNEDLQVDGSVEGLVRLEDHKLTVGASAKVTADIIAREVVVWGSVTGKLKARDRIEIKKNGSVKGNSTAARIMIEEGAHYNGSIETDKTGLTSDSSHEEPSESYAKSSRDTTTASTSDALSIR